MPDWTYLPVRPVVARLVGPERAVRLALTSAATLAATGAGQKLIMAVGGTRPPAGAARMVDGLACPSPVAVRIGAANVEPALRVLPALGAGLVEIGPVSAAELPRVRAALHRRLRGPVPGVPVVVVLAPGVSTSDDLGADRVVDHSALSPTAQAVPVDGPHDAVRAADRGATLVLVTGGQLTAGGPGLIGRITEAVVARDHRGPRPGLRAELSGDPRRWPTWIWALLNGFGLIGGGLGAAVITLGPVLLWYDQSFLGSDVPTLALLSPHLIGFIQHDRISLAGSMVACGAIYVGFALAMRAGWDWARLGLLASGLVGFPTLAYFLAWGFFEPLHTALTIVVFPMWIVAVRRPVSPQWLVAPDGPEPMRRRALVGQLGLVALGVGLFVGGAAISTIGLSDVFVDSDLAFLATTSHHLEGANARLLAFVAHDRAGFGGVLMAGGVAIAFLAARGWRRGAAGTWWALMVAGLFGWLPAIAIHLAVGYLDLLHLLPVYLGLALTIASLIVAKPYLCAEVEVPILLEPNRSDSRLSMGETPP